MMSRTWPTVTLPPISTLSTILIMPLTAEYGRSLIFVWDAMAFRPGLEIVSMMIIIFTFLVLPHVTARNGHVRTTMLYDKVGRNGKLVIDLIASILGVPPYLLGVGEFKQDEWNAFINNTVRPICREIEQEMTRKLIISEKWYLMFNIASLYSYDLQTTANVYQGLMEHGVVTGNEVREKIGMEPKDGLDELLILENYIPASKSGDQKKLN